MVISFIIIVLHYIGDFIFQDEEWAVNKSKSFICLIRHTLTYSFLWFVSSYLLFRYYEGYEPSESFIGSIIFFSITLLTHTVTDYYTSRITSNLFAKKKLGSPIPNLGAFSMIGFDQILHYLQLFTTYYFVTKFLEV